MNFRLTLLIIVIVACFAVNINAQSGRTKPSPTPMPNSISGPSVLNTPAPTPRNVATPKTTSQPINDDVVKIDSMLVPIPVSVFDATGKAISTLKNTDFELRIDGKIVEIGDVYRSDSPIRVAMLFDNSSSVIIARDFERDAAVRFFKRVIRPATDTAALFSVADQTRLEQPLTNNIGLLTRAIDLFPPPAGATALFEGIVEASDYLRSSTGRRVLVIVSDGEDTYSDMQITLEVVIRNLQLNNVQVYVVKTKDFENYKRTGSRAGNANIRSLTAERRMLEITQQTGGAVYSPIEDREMNAAFDDISAALAQQYVISYYPEDEAGKTGEFRTITVDVKARQNLTVRARKGYYVPKN